MQFNRVSYLEELKKYMWNGRIKTITGLRRVGKSYLLFTLFVDYLLSFGVPEANIIMINLEEQKNIKLRNPFSLLDYIEELASDKSKKYYILIDEIQMCESVPNPYLPNSPNKITFTDTLLSLMNIKNYDVYVTGSNSKMLSRDILTTFRDRSDNILVHPLSFQEIVHLYDSKYEALDDYFLYGGMPLVFNFKTSSEKNKYLRSVYELTYLKDILDRYNLAERKSIIDDLLKVIASSIGSLTNPKKLADTFKSTQGINISNTTIANYLDFFSNAFLINKAERFDVKGRKYLTTPFKYYFTDIGIRNALLNFRQIEKTHIMENIIYNELIRRGFTVDIGAIPKEVYRNGKKERVSYEIDFIASCFSKKYYIQSALNVDDRDKLEQELRPFLSVDDYFTRVIVVYDPQATYYDDNGILFISLSHFLLDESVVNIY